MQTTKLTEMQLKRAQLATEEDFQTNGKDMSLTGEDEQEEVSLLPSKLSGEPIKDLKKHWSTPKDVSELARQANEVATLVLNHKMTLDTARAYSAITKTIAQAKSLEVQRARYLNKEPDMSLTNNDLNEQRKPA